MADDQANSIEVAVRVRPLNGRERDEGHRNCVTFDEATRQVVLEAVDKNTLFQLRGATAKGYAFDKRFGQEESAESIYNSCVAPLVEKCFQGYNATVMAYGQTGSGKTHTMTGGIGIYGLQEEGITPRVIRHIFQVVEALNKRAKPGEGCVISACALELYNEELRDLSAMGGQTADAQKKGWDLKEGGPGLKLQERPVGKEGKVVPEVIGIREQVVHNSHDLLSFYDSCLLNRSTSATKLNDRSSRSHAIFTVNIKRTVVTVVNDDNGRGITKMRTEELGSKFHLVDLAGSERVKRSGVTGKELKEATHINSGLLALGNVIQALATEGESGKKGHIPYRDSKLTRLLQDSLGGNSLTVLISCISPSEADFEETNNTLKYANRACKIKNTPLPNKFMQLEEDLLPMIPQSNNNGFSLMQLQQLLEDHGRLKEARERRDKEKREKEEKRLAVLASMKEGQLKSPGFQRIRAAHYDELRKQLIGKKGAKLPDNVTINTVEGIQLRRENSSPDLAADRAHRTGTQYDGGSSTPRYMQATSAVQRKKSESPGSESPRQMGRVGSARKVDTGSSADLTGEELRSQEIGSDGHVEQGEPSHQPAPAGKARFRKPAPKPAHADEDGDPMDVEKESQDATVTVSNNKTKFKRQAKKDDGVDDGPAAGGHAHSQSHDPQLDSNTPGSSSAPEGYDVYDDDMGEPDDLDVPKVLARFKVNQHDTLSVFKANTKEDFKDVISLLPENTPLPASDKMTYLLARLELKSGRDLGQALQRVAMGESTMNESVGPAVGCLMATFGTNMIASCIFDFDDPPELELFSVDERIELWGLQIPHNSVRPTLQVPESANDNASEVSEARSEPRSEKEDKEKDVVHWTSVDRLQMSIGLLYALCNHAIDNDVRCGFCVPRPQLLRRWLQAGVKMKQITGNMRLIYPPTAHDYDYYKTSTVAYFMVQEVKEGLEKVLGLVGQ